MKLHEAFSSEESKQIYANFLAIVNDPKRRDRLVRLHGANAENVAYGTAVNQVKRQAANNIEEPSIEQPIEEPTTEEPMDKETKLKEMIQAALSKPLSEKKGKDRDGDGDIDQQDYLIARDIAIKKAKGKVDEDMDLGHEDDEPHMLKADLYRIGKYAMELYKMVDQFDNGQEVDFPHWWQSKIVQAKSMLVAAKHYLDFELKEPQIDAMVDVASQEDIINEKMSKKQIKKRGEIYDALKDKGMSDEKAGKIATSKAQKIKEAVLAKLQESKGEYAKIEKEIADLKSKGKTLKDPEMVKLIKRRAELEKSKTKDIAEGVFDRIKAQVKGTTSDIGQRIKNVGAALKGKPEEFQNPAIASGMAKIKSKAKNFESDVENMLNDLNALFPEEKLEKTPEIKELIDSYKQLLNSILKVNTTLASGKPVNVTTKPKASTQTTPQYTQTTTQTTSAKPRDEKGRFVSTKE